MRHLRRYILLVAALLVVPAVLVETPARAGSMSAALPAGLPSLPVPTLPSLLPSLPPLPLPTSPPALPHPHTTPPTAPVPVPQVPGLPALPGLPGLPGQTGQPGQPGQPPGTTPTPAPGAGSTTGATAGDAGSLADPLTAAAAAAIIGSDPGADLYPQVPVDPATSPQSQLVARLADVQRRVQYLRNVLARTRSDLAVAQSQLDATGVLITMLTAPALSGGPQDKVLALSSAIMSGEADLGRTDAAVLLLQQQIDNGVRMTLASSSQLPTATTTYGGGRLRRPVPGGITSSFGNRFDPYYHVWQLHAGIDIGAPPGTPIVAAASGRVARAGWDGGYGNYTCIDHGQFNGQRLSTCYGHQSLILVRPGQQVSAGQIIGRVGATGAATGPHLHFEVRLGGRPVDPIPWI